MHNSAIAGLTNLEALISLIGEISDFLRFKKLVLRIKVHILINLSMCYAAIPY